MMCANLCNGHWVIFLIDALCFFFCFIYGTQHYFLYYDSLVSPIETWYIHTYIYLFIACLYCNLFCRCIIRTCYHTLWSPTCDLFWCCDCALLMLCCLPDIWCFLLLVASLYANFWVSFAICCYLWITIHSVLFLVSFPTLILHYLLPWEVG